MPGEAIDPGRARGPVEKPTPFGHGDDGVADREPAGGDEFGEWPVFLAGVDPRVPALKAAWIRGYEKIQPLNDAEKAEIDTLVMLRRMALLAWIGSHIEAPEPQALAPGFAATTARLGQDWLNGVRF